MPRQVERVGRLTREVFARDFLRRSRPVIMTEPLRNWRALSSWTPESLGRLFRTREVRVAASGNGIFKYDPRARAVYQSELMEFSRAVSLICERVVTAKKHYLMQTSIPRIFPELVRDIDTPEYIGAGDVTANLWFGAAESVTPLHYDMANNLFGQVYGRKRFMLFSPTQASRLYSFPTSARHPHMSRVDIEDPDLERFPEFRKAVSTECVVGPGDLLFIPAFWWHHVRSLDVAISVSFWWPPLLPQFLAPAGLRMIPFFYDRDRLAGVRTLLRAAGESGQFIGAARFFHARNELGAAILFAAAALDELLRNLGRRIGRRQKNVSASGEIEATSAELVRAGVYSEQAHARIVAWGSLVAAARRAANHGVSPGRVSRMIQGVESFVARYSSRA